MKNSVVVAVVVVVAEAVSAVESRTVTGVAGTAEIVLAGVLAVPSKQMMPRLEDVVEAAPATRSRCVDCSDSCSSADASALSSHEAAPGHDLEAYVPDAQWLARILKMLAEHLTTHAMFVVAAGSCHSASVVGLFAALVEWEIRQIAADTARVRRC